MKKMGSIKFYNDINLNIKFNFDDLCHHLFKKRMLTKGKTDDDVVKENLIDSETGFLKLDLIEEAVQSYVNVKIKEEFGTEYFLDVMDDTMNISWDINVESIKKHHEEKWWDKQESKSPTLPKLKKV